MHYYTHMNYICACYLYYLPVPHVFTHVYLIISDPFLHDCHLEKIQNLKLRNLVRVLIGNKILLIETCWNRVCDKSTRVLLAIYMNIKMLACPEFHYNVVLHY